MNRLKLFICAACNVKLFYSLGLALLVCCSGCFSIRPGATRSGKKVYERFYAGQGVNQYFIKPVSFDNRHSQLEMDITFRVEKDSAHGAMVNFSVFDTDLIKAADSLVIVNSKAKIKIDKLDFMFTERQKLQTHSRFSSHISIYELANLFTHQHWEIALYANKKAYFFSSSSNTNKRLSLINHHVFSIVL
jgi:hypothetical protein